MIKSWKPQELSISYHQFTVFQKDSTPPIMDWTDEAIEKGYTAADEPFHLRHSEIQRPLFFCA